MEDTVLQIRHPFEWLSLPAQKRAWIGLLILTLAVMGGLRRLDRPLRTEAASGGIISFEFAGTLEQARAMLASWGSQGRIHAGVSLGLDYLFLVLYSSGIALGCVLVGQWLAIWSRHALLIGTLLAWGQLGAALLDGTENYALVQLLLGTEQAIWPLVAWWCAAPKFMIVVMGMLYMFCGGIMHITIRIFAIRKSRP